MSKHAFRLVGRTFTPHDLVASVFRTRAGARAGATAAKGSEALSEIRAILGLSEAELADLFGVRRESIAGWRKAGIPDTRRASVARLLDLARILNRDLKPDRIPEIVRTHDDWLEHGTILKTIQHAGVAPVYAYLHRLFSYAG